jgi:hypothetical protein
MRFAPYWVDTGSDRPATEVSGEVEVVGAKATGQATALHE